MLKKYLRPVSRLTLLGLALMSFTQTVRAEIAVKSDEKIAFLGDSITQQGAGSASGYVRLVMSGLEANNIKAEAIPAGISGHKSNDMLARVDKDVIEKKPNWMTLSCGVNDVWHQERNRGILIEEYKTNIRAIVDKAQAAGIKVLLLTSTMIGEDQSGANNQKLIPYNDFLKALAAEKNLPIADLNSMMQEQAKAPHKGNLATTDGVHMNPIGNQMMAIGVLKAFGASEAQLQTAREAWSKIPHNIGASLTLGQWNKLSEVANKSNRTIDEVIKAAVEKAITEG
ncbi:MAG TPA: GDSL-type esterase/lipase family protein [Abditibacteriaceae bacterium]